MTGGGGISQLLGQARILHLASPFEGLTKIVNVFFPVGPHQPNQAEDVRVVQNLMHAVALFSAGRAGISAPEVNGRFDAVTGFWIFYLQSTLRAGHIGVVDGIVSPARGGAYFGATPSFIAHLNGAAHRANPAVFQSFLNVFEAGSGGQTFGV
jgi:hypothetical protein